MTRSDDDQSFDWHARLLFALLALGALLLVASFILPTRSLGQASWSKSEAKEYQSASMKLHGLSHAAVHAKPAEQQALRKDLAQAQADYDAIRAKLNSAVSGPRKTAWVLRITGVACLVIGGVGAFFRRRSADV
jgi:hypothetical protein